MIKIFHQSSQPCRIGNRTRYKTLNRSCIDNMANNWRNGKSRQQSRTLRISSNLLSGFLAETRSRLVALLYTISLSLPACPADSTINLSDTVLSYGHFFDIFFILRVFFLYCLPGKNILVTLFLVLGNYLPTKKRIYILNYVNFG